MPAPEIVKDPATHTTMVTVKVEADPAAATALVTDAARIPQWAPGFADAVHVQGDGAVSATKDGRRFSLRVAVDVGAGSVDLLRAVAPVVEDGAHLRVTPQPGRGSVIEMGVPVGADGDAEDAAATVRAELTALAQLLGSSLR